MYVLSQSVVTINPKTAEYMKNEYAYDRQRKLRKSTVEKYARDMRNFRFLSIQPLLLARCNGKTYLIDGWHRLEAVITSQVSGVSFPVTTVSVDSEEELHRLYASLDDHTPRSPNDAFKAVNLQDETGLTLKELRSLNSATRFLDADWRPRSYNKKSSRTEMVQNCRRYSTEALQYFTITRNAISEMRNPLRRRGVVAVALVTYQKAIHAVDVSTFWRRVADFSGLEYGHPCFSLALKLSTMTHREDEEAKLCAITWNKFWKSKEIKRFKGFNSQSTVEIDYTSVTVPAYGRGRNTDNLE